MSTNGEDRKYNKVSYTAKAKLLHKIIFEGKSIKDASSETDINYSTAKTILTIFRRKLHLQKGKKTMKSVLSGTTSPQPDMYPCSYRLNCSGNQTIQQVVTVGGKEEIAYVRSSFRIKVGQPIQVVSNTPLESQN